MQLTFPPPRAPAGREHDRIAIRELRAPSGNRPVVFRHSWRVQPGETFAAGTVLGELSLVPPPAAPAQTGGLLSGVMSRLAGKAPAPPVQLSPITAPEDGVLTWRPPADGDIRPGELLAAYIPLPAWQQFVALLTEHDRQFAGGAGKQAGAPAPVANPAGRAVRKDDLSGKLAAMIVRLPGISAREIRADRSGMLAQLVRQIRNTLRSVCPVTPEDLALIYHRYFQLIETTDARLRLIDARYAARWRDPACSAEETEEIINAWLEHKEEVIMQITGETAEPPDAEGHSG